MPLIQWCRKYTFAHYSIYFSTLIQSINLLHLLCKLPIVFLALSFIVYLNQFSFFFLITYICPVLPISLSINWHYNKNSCFWNEREINCGERFESVRLFIKCGLDKRTTRSQFMVVLEWNAKRPSTKTLHLTQAIHLSCQLDFARVNLTYILI